MGQAADQTIAEMDEARAALGHDLDELEAGIRREVKATFDVRRHPWLVAGFLLVVGLLIAKIVRS